jgi:hypothetical protein
VNTITLLKQYIHTFREDHIPDDEYNTPTKKVIAIVDYLLSCCEQHHVIPNRVAKSVIGGVGITFRKNKEEKDYIEIRNSGGMSHLHSVYHENTFKVLEVMELKDTQFNAVLQVIKNRNNEIICKICETCKTWGKTITRSENNNAIPCPDCGRLTWPNLGVNCHGGTAVSFSACNNIWATRGCIKK